MISRTQVKNSHAGPDQSRLKLSMYKRKISGDKSSRTKTNSYKTSSENMIREVTPLDKAVTPLDFDRFIPWVLFILEGIIHVNVKRITCRKVKNLRKAKQVSTSMEILPVRSMDEASLDEGSTQTFYYPSTNSIHRRSAVAAYSEVIITALYDSKENLTEIAFIDCSVLVPREVFKAIHLCLPFHYQLTRLTFKGKHLDCGTLYEISEMLPVSNLTDVILDHSNVAQGYYYILLEQASKLKYLSLRNCGIDDAECEKIARRIRRSKPVAKHLLVLNLSINNITDAGAKALGRSLRTNRQLLYLNLCNNSITNDGAAHILLPLTEFQLNRSEKRVLKESKCEIVKQKVAAVSGNLKDITNKSNVASTTTTSSKYAFTKNKSLRPGYKRVKINSGLVDTTASDGAGAGPDIFCFNTVYREGVWYSLGNFTLCSLNLAYNRLDFTSISRITNVLTYQSHQEKGSQTGLLRVVFEGNNLPGRCDEYDYIEDCLDIAKKNAAPKSISQSAMKISDSVRKSKRKHMHVKHDLVNASL